MTISFQARAVDGRIIIVFIARGLGQATASPYGRWRVTPRQLSLSPVKCLNKTNTHYSKVISNVTFNRLDLCNFEGTYVKLRTSTATTTTICAGRATRERPMMIITFRSCGLLRGAKSKNIMLTAVIRQPFPVSSSNSAVEFGAFRWNRHHFESDFVVI